MRPGRRSRPAGETDAALLLDGHSRAAVETLQSLGRAGIAVDVSSECECLAFRSRYCRHRLPQPDSSDPEAFVIWLSEVVGANRYSLIVPSTETSLRCLSRLPESHAVRHKAVLPPNRALEVALSKQLTWELAKSLEVAVPASRLITAREEVPDSRDFPRVLKPVTSMVAAGGEMVCLTPVLVRTRNQWARALDNFLPLCPVLEQEYVAGSGLGIECLYKHGSCVWYFQHERVHELPLTGGGSTYRRSSPVDKSLLTEATRLLDNLKWHGVAMVEFKGSAERGFRLMEINPRLWGSLALAVDAGVDFPIGLWSVATETDPGPQPSYRWPYYTRNLKMDLDWFKDNMQADHSDPLLLTKPKLRSLLEYGRPLLGTESWDHFDLWDWRVWSHVLYSTLQACWRTAASAITRVGRPYLLWWRHRRLLAELHRSGGVFVRRILFVCYGNVCRSPLAELYARKLAPEMEVASAGFHEKVDRSPPVWYQAIAAELGVDLSVWLSKRVDREQVEWSQLVLLADLENLDRFRQEFPDALCKATLLGLFSPTRHTSIEDPYNLDASRARLAARAVVAAVEGLVAWSRAQTDG